jgi:hypothetical protein
MLLFYKDMMMHLAGQLKTVAHSLHTTTANTPVTTRLPGSASAAKALHVRLYLQVLYNTTHKTHRTIACTILLAV